MSAGKVDVPAEAPRYPAARLTLTVADVEAMVEGYHQVPAGTRDMKRARIETAGMALRNRFNDRIAQLVEAADNARRVLERPASSGAAMDEAALALRLALAALGGAP